MIIKKLVTLFSIIITFIGLFSVSTEAAVITIDMSTIRWSSNSHVYDGTEKRIYLEFFPADFPSDIHVIYEDASAIDVGIYTAKVRLSYDDDKYRLTNIKFQNERKWQIRKPYVVDETGTILISADYGIHPNQTIIYEEFDLDDYAFVDCTVAGAYQEVKRAFTITMMENDRPTLPDGVIVIEYTIPEDLLYVEDLEIFDYGMNRLNTVESRVKDGKIIFNTHHLSDTYLVVGMRSTYTNNQIWKVYLIFTVCFLGICGLIFAIRYKKRKEEILAQDKELYTRSKLR